jgi:very-short-patch-repair endonuclease
VKKNWFQIAAVADQLRDAASYVGAAASRNFTRSVIGVSGDRASAFSGVESPLEAIFLIWFGAVAQADKEDYSDDFQLMGQRDVNAGGSKFRLDFVIAPSLKMIARTAEFPMEFPKIAIEVDGHAFHEKTVEQVAYRNQRDRALQADGWTVFHYSWSEMTTRQAQCVGEVLSFATDRYSELDQAYFTWKWAQDRDDKAGDGENT